jgi:hypothetical protein
MNAADFGRALALRRRRCCVYQNPAPERGFHLLLVDDDGGLILAEQVNDPEAAIWLAPLVNQALAAAASLAPLTRKGGRS